MSGIGKGRDRGFINAIGDTWIPLKTITECIDEKLNLPVLSLGDDKLTQYFEWMAGFIGVDCPTAALQTKQQLGWKPFEINLLHDMQESYF